MSMSLDCDEGRGSDTSPVDLRFSAAEFQVARDSSLIREDKRVFPRIAPSGSSSQGPCRMDRETSD